MTSDLLHDERSCGDARQQMMVVDASREKPIGDLQQIDLTRPQHILGL